MNFYGIEVYTAAFFHGLLDGISDKVKDGDLTSRIKLINISELGIKLFNSCSENIYRYNNDINYRKAIDEIMKDNE